jgi:hypothetical protein
MHTVKLVDRSSKLRFTRFFLRNKKVIVIGKCTSNEKIKMAERISQWSQKQIYRDIIKLE